MIWQGSVATKGGNFLSGKLLETTPQLLPQLYHTVWYLDVDTAHSRRVFVPSLVYGCTYRVTSVQHRYLNLVLVTGHSQQHRAQHRPVSSASWVYVKRYFFSFVQKLALKRIQTELHSPKAMFSVGSFNAQLTSKDERFQDHRNFSSHAHISYPEGQTRLRYYIGLLIHVNVLPLKFQCPAKT